MKKTYPSKDSKSWIEPYKVHDHAWSDEHLDKTNRDSYCSSAPAGYDTGLDCDFYYPADDENNDPTSEQRQALADLTKEMTNRTWYFGKSETEKSNELKFTAGDEVDDKNWTQVGNEEDNHGRWNLTLTKHNDTILRFFQNGVIIPFKLEKSEPHIVFGAGEQEEEAFNKALIFSSDKPPDKKIELKAIQDTGASFTISDQETINKPNWQSVWLRSSSGFSEADDTVGKTPEKEFYIDVTLNEAMKVNKLFFRKTPHYSGKLGIKQFSIQYKPSAAAKEWSKYKDGEKTEMKIGADAPTSQLFEYKLEPAFKAEVIRVYWHGNKKRIGRFDLQVEADPAKYGKTEGVIANKNKYLKELKQSSFRPRPVGYWGTDDIGLAGKNGFHAKADDESFHIDFILKEPLKVSHLMLKKRGDGNKGQWIDKVQIAYKAKGDEETFTAVENAKNFSTGLSRNMNTETEKKVTLKPFTAKVVRVYLHSSNIRAGRLELFVQQPSAEKPEDDKPALLQRELTSQEKALLGNYRMNDVTYKF